MQSIELSRDLSESYLTYAIEVITDRALPRVEDGLNPVQRRILYAMHQMGLTHDKPYKKSARVVGEVLGKFHPHGDASVYGSMVRLAQEFSLREPLIDGQGNFGSIDGDPAAAMRYTEARLSAIAAYLLPDIGRDAVDFTDNFDGSLQEPVILPAQVPNLLVNGSSGVAVGMATNIPPHNLGEVCDAVSFMAQHWAERDKITVAQLMAYLPGPDFPTGGLAYRYRVENDATVDILAEAYAGGRGRLVTQARLDIEQRGGGKADIVVSELPYQVQKSTVLERIAAEVRDGRITGVTDLRDESDYTGMRVVIEVSRSAQPEAVLEQLLTRTQLRQTFGINLMALVEEEGQVVPKLLNLPQMLIYFIQHRLVVIERRSRHELAEREARLHIIEGLLKALDLIDQVIDTIRKSQSPDSARQNLIKNFGFSAEQAQAILDMPLRRLAALERKKLRDEGREVWERIKLLRALLAAEEKRLEVVGEETAALKEGFANPRRTVILANESQAAGRTAATTAADLLVPTEPQIVALTTQGLIRSEARGFSYRVKPGEISSRAVESQLRHLTVEPDQAVLLVTNRGRAWRGPVGRIPPRAGFADLGLKDKEETIIGLDRVEPDQLLLLATRAGLVKRTAIDQLNEASWTSLIGGDDEVILAGLIDETAEVLLLTPTKAIRFEASQINPQGPSARGVAGIKLGKGEKVRAGQVYRPGSRAMVVIASEGGYLKRVPLEEFPLQNRGGGGVQTLATTKTSGPVATAIAVPATGVVDLISSRGRRQRLALTEIPLADRRKAGQALAGFGEDDLLHSLVYFEG